MIYILRNPYHKDGPASIMANCWRDEIGFVHELIDDLTDEKGRTELLRDWEIGQFLGGN